MVTARPRTKSKRSKRPKGPAGRISKRTPQLEKQLLEIISTGLPLKFAAASVGVSFNAMDNWRRADPEFAERVDLAIAASGRARWELIRKAGVDNEKGRGDWKSQAWLLERRFPREFSRPEIQLNLCTGLQNSGNGADGSHSFETLVLDDLRFAELRKNPNYEHRRSERPVREVETEVVVEPNLSGTLVRSDHPRSAVISKTHFEHNACRSERASAKIQALLAAKHSQSRAAKPVEAGPEKSRALVPGVITIPDGEPSQGWWSQLATGSNTREIDKQTAIEVCRIILRDTLGGLVAQTTPIDFDQKEPVTLRDLHEAIQDLVGAKAWTTLLKKAGHE